MKALLFAIVLHDIGTPPFGHTLEYEFIRRFGRDHEQAAASVLDATHHPFALDHQIYAGKTVQLPSLIDQTGCALAIRAILSGTHPLSRLVFGDLDLDNIDNVYRMSWYLGARCNPTDAVRLASSIDIDRDGRKYLSLLHRPLVESWLRLRRNAYEVLLNSSRHRQNQTIFSRIIFEAMEGSATSEAILDLRDWFLTDEDLVRCLRKELALKPYFNDLDRAGLLPEVHIEFELGERLNRSELVLHRDAIGAELIEGASGPFYISLIPYGEVLERKIQFIDRSTGDAWSVGSPKLTYRIHVYIGGKAARSGDTGAAKSATLEKVREYARRSGWIS